VAAKGDSFCALKLRGCGQKLHRLGGSMVPILKKSNWDAYLTARKQYEEHFESETLKYSENN